MATFESEYENESAYHSFHGTVSTISHGSDLYGFDINRSTFIDKTLKAQTMDNIKSRTPLLVLFNHIDTPVKKSKYQLQVYGHTICGTKTTVIIDNIKPVVDVKITFKNTGKENIISRLNKVASSCESEIVSYEFLKGRDFLFYSHKQSEYVRLCFNSIRHRDLFIREAESKKLHLRTNDYSHYHRVLARLNDMQLSGWNELKDYQYNIQSSDPLQLQSCTFRSEIIITVDLKNVLPVLETDPRMKDSLLKFENSIMHGFDIEMLPQRIGHFPDATKNISDEIFMICSTYHFAKKSGSLLNVLFTLKKSNPVNGFWTIHCQSEATLLHAFSIMNSLMQPEFTIAHNGDGFDWKQIIIKSKHFGVFPSFVDHMSIKRLEQWEKNPKMLERFVSRSEMKTGANMKTECVAFRCSGFIGFDTLTVQKQLFPNAESHKLDECLKRANLGGKVDLTPQRMFDIYRRGDPEEMREVSYYCFIDTVKLHELILKQNVIQDRREVSNISYVSLNDSFCYADGCKMRNLLMNRGSKRGYFFDVNYRPADKNSEEKFVGAFVQPPTKGIVAPMKRFDEMFPECTNEEIANVSQIITDNFDTIFSRDSSEEHPKDLSGCFRVNPLNIPKDDTISDSVRDYVDYLNTHRNQYPVSGLDFASLYPSIIMTYNISPDYLVVKESYAKSLEESGKNLLHTKVVYDGKIYPAWFVRHDNDLKDMSVCGQLLLELGAKRKELKKILAGVSHRYADLIIAKKKFHESNPSGKFPDQEEMNEIAFIRTSCDSKQKAVKIFMNTLYGEMGNSISCICALEVAASITMMGRYNLKLAKSVAEKQLEMTLYYGDTDSLYVACNPKHYQEYDLSYFTFKIDKLEYGKLLVERTFEQISIARDVVNKVLFEDNGSKYLQMAYEEVLYPVVFLSKKKYVGVPHEDRVEFYPKYEHLFTKGLECNKRGASQILKDVSEKAIMEMVDINCKKPLLRIIEDVILDIFKVNWPIEYFAKSKSYKPDKHNPVVIRLMERYRAIGYHSIPGANERFKTVICKQYPWTYDVKGNQSKLSIGDRIEILSRVIEENLEIDLEYYVSNEIAGMFSRLISFDPSFRFNIPEPNPIPEGITEAASDAIASDNYKKMDDRMMKNASKFIDNLISKHSNSYTNKASLFKNTYSVVSDYLGYRTDIKNKYLSLLSSKLINKLSGMGTTISGIRCALTMWISELKPSLEENDISMKVGPIVEYIIDNDIVDTIVNFQGRWVKNVVDKIKNDYDYDLICRKNLPYESLNDLLSRSELELIASDPDCIPNINDHSERIINMIASIIA